MKINTINFKFLAVVTGAFILMAFNVNLCANYFLKKIIDHNQHEIYSEKIDTILGMLNRKYNRLMNTFLAEAYEDDFKHSFLSDFRKDYYRSIDRHNSYPFIISDSGKNVAHPDYMYGDSQLAQTDIVKKIISTKSGSFNYVYKGTKKWIIYKHFDGWNWIVGFSIPLKIKYAEFNAFKKILGTIMLVTTLVALLIVSLLITRFTRPIYELTSASEELASGNLGYPINIKSRDELGTLAHSFITMRNSISEQIDVLNKQNIKLTTEIAERKKISKALKESEKRYRLLIENQNDLIVKFDRENRLLFVSPSYCETFNKPEEELVEHEFIPLIHDDDKDYVKKSIQQVFSPPYTYYHEERALTRDGWRWFAWSGKGIVNESGEVKEVIAVGRDITERKNIEETREQLIQDLEQKNAEMERFSYTVSHDLKTPLITI